LTNRILITYKSIILITITLLLLFFSGNLYSQDSINKILTSETVYILPLGNSITSDNRTNDLRNIGERAGYRAPLYNLLKNAGYNFDFLGSEHSGGNYLPAGYDEHAGFPGITDDQLLFLLQTGQQLQPNQGIDRQITAGPYLNTYSADLILLHIGTNDNDQPEGTSSIEVEQILDEIDAYELYSGKQVIVLLARIVNRVPNENYVDEFNNNVESMVIDRISNPSNDAYPDNVIIVDMQDSANFNYVISPDPNGLPGDMNDALHPNDKGYSKMAQQWFQALKSVLPTPPIILAHPVDQFTVESGSASFSISVDDNESVTYQWRKNGSNIYLATDSLLNLQNVSIADNNAVISCIVTNTNGSVTSKSSNLYVNSKLERIKNGLLAEYDFEEGQGTIIYNKYEDNAELNLQINTTETVDWIMNGISINNISDISTSSSVVLLNDSIGNSNQFSFELWLSTSQISQTGPARIVTISANENERNFTLGQSSDNFVLRTRTTETDLNGLPEVITKTDMVENEMVHVFFTRNENSYQNIYVDGVLIESTYVGGDLSNWNSDYKLALGNEFISNQPWLGNIYHLDIYNRALNIDEIQHNFNLGEDGITSVNYSSPNLASQFELYQNYPNPFNPSTVISFTLSKSSSVSLSVYDVLGCEIMEVVEDNLSAGNYSYQIDASQLSSGVFIYSISAKDIDGNSFVSSKKMIFLK